ncbi:MAG: hypothetical protein AAF483_24530, partial [Planctomycetota bacterium]
MTMHGNSNLLSRILVVFSALSVLVPPLAVAEEPFEKFLNRLKAERHFDLALSYLDRLEQGQNVPPQVAAGLELERGLLQYQSAAMMTRSNPKRQSKLAEAEKSLREFLNKRKQNPRRGEARLKLGELLLQRADEAKSKIEDPKIANPSAIEFYDSAHNIFEQTIKELAATLDTMKGARTDPNDKKAVAYRQKVQQDIRQAQLLSAKSVEERGRSRGEKDQKADLKQAEKMFTNLYLKEQRLVGVRNYALYYRSTIQRDLGDDSAAMDGFLRVSDQEGVDELRPLQSIANLELLKLYVAAKNVPAAVSRVDKWIAGLRPDEKATKETIDLKLELARTKIDWSNALKKEDPNDRVAPRLTRDTRTELKSLLRIQGPHLEKVRELLAELGSIAPEEEEPEEEIPEVKDFSEAIAVAQKRIERAESDTLGIAILEENGQDEEAEELKASISRTRLQAIQLLRQSFALYRDSDDLEKLYQARFSLAYLYLREQQPWEALTLARYVAEKNPRTAIGLKSASVALGAFSDLLRLAGEKERVLLTDYLEPFSQYLIKIWPDSSEASISAAALVQLALANKQWDKVDKFLALAPKEGKAMAGLRRDAGISFFNRYLDEKEKSGDSATQTQALKKRALESLQIATKDLKAADLNDGFVNAINALSRLYLMDQKLDAAAKLLVQGEGSPLKVAATNPNAISAKVAMNSYRTAIQLTVSQLASGKIQSAQAVVKCNEYITSLQKLAAGIPKGQKTLTSIFYSLAKDLKSQLADEKQAAKRKRLSEATMMLAEQAATDADFNTQYWAVDTIVSLAEELLKTQDGKATGQAGFAKAITILSGILEEQKTNENFISPVDLKLEVQRQLAMAQRGTGDFKAAMNTFSDILKANNALLPIQIEAARTYQQWGDAVNLGFYKPAYLGGRPDDRTRKNLIWG